MLDLGQCTQEKIDSRLHCKAEKWKQKYIFVLVRFQEFKRLMPSNVGKHFRKSHIVRRVTF